MALAPAVTVPGSTKSRTVVSALLLAFALVASSLAVLTIAPITPADAAASGRTFVWDTFSRTVRAGLGKAQQGGAYSVAFRGGNPYKVSRHGRAAVQVRSTGASATLRSVRARDVVLDSSIAVTKRQSGRFGLTSSLGGRQQRNGDGYRAVVGVDRSGHLTLAIRRTSHGKSATLAQKRLHGRVTTGRPIRISLAIAGSYPVSVAARAFLSGSRTPGWQAKATDRSSRRVATAGSVAVGQRAWRGVKPVQARLVSLWGRTSDRRASAVKPRPVKPGPVKPGPVKPGPVKPTDPTTPTTPTTPTNPTDPTTPANPTTRAAGSVPVGDAQYPAPANAVYVSSASGSDSDPGTVDSPKRTIAAAVRSASGGRTIVLRAGSYHESLNISAAASGVTIQNYPGEAAWLDGSVPVASWTRSGSSWTTPWSAQFDHSKSFTTGSDAGGFVNGSYPMAAWPDMVFVDGAQLRQVGSAAEVRDGTFFVDYSARTLRIGSDPSGHAVRASDLASAITVSATNFTVRGIGVRRYANALPKGGAIYFARSGDRLENVVVSDTATQGVSLYDAAITIDRVTVERAGMLGVTAYKANGSVVQNSLVVNSNTERFNKEPSAAGMKLVRSTDFIVRDNVVRNSYNAHGIWFDISSKRVTVVRNTVLDNGAAPSIEIELSSFATVADNVVRGGTHGVYVYNSSDVKVVNNSFSGNGTGSVFLLQDGRRAASSGMTDPECTWVIKNVYVANNDFGWNGGPYGLQFYALDGQTHIPASDMNITLVGNRFHLRGSGSSDSMVGWGGSNGKITNYDTPAALNKALGKTWQNTQVASGTQYSGTAGDTGEPLGSDVARAIGQATGSRHVGSFAD